MPDSVLISSLFKELNYPVNHVTPVKIINYADEPCEENKVIIIKKFDNLEVKFKKNIYCEENP